MFSERERERRTGEAGCCLANLSLCKRTELVGGPVRPRKRCLITHRVSSNRTQIVDLNNNTITLCQRRVAVIRVRLARQLIAFPTRGTFARARPDAKEVLGGGGVETGVAVEGTGCGIGVAVAGTEGVASAVSVWVDVSLRYMGTSGGEGGDRGLLGESCH